MPKITAKVTLFAAAAMFAGCFDSSTSSNTTADTTPIYVAVGNSLTAGFQSGGLLASHQKVSYPALIAKQMGIADVDFQLPLVDSPGIGSIPGKTPYFLDSANHIVNAALTKDPATLLLNATYAKPYNDLAVPGAWTTDFLHAHDASSCKLCPLQANGYFDIVLRPSLFNNKSIIQEAIDLKPTIMTLWIGANDILTGVTAGTVDSSLTVSPTALYKSMMDSIVDTLLHSTSAHLFIANIPSITSIPYVTTIPPVYVDTNGVPDLTTPLVTEEANVKYVLLPAQVAMAQGIGIPASKDGPGTPLPKELTLTVDEAATADALVNGYNAYLQAKADANADRITVVDIHSLLDDLNSGKIAGLSSKFISLDPLHTAFSLDGIHPNDAGYKVIANFYIDAINKAMAKSYAHVE